MTIGEKIKFLRKEKKLTQSQLAGKKMTKSMLSQIENNNAMPSMKNLKYIAKALEKPLSYFIKEDSKALPLKEIKYKLDIAKEHIDKYQIDEGIKILESILKEFNIDKNTKVYADIMCKLADCQSFLKNFEKSEEYLKKSINIYKDNNLYSYAAKTYIDLIARYWDEQNFNECLIILNKAKEMHDKSTSNDVSFKIKYFQIKSLILSSIGKIHDTINILDKSIKLSKESGIYYKSDEVYKTKSLMNILLENYDEFLKNIKKGKQFAKFTENNISLISLELITALYYNELKQPKKALKHLDITNELINNEDNNYIDFYVKDIFYNEKAKSYYHLKEYKKGLKELSKCSYSDSKYKSKYIYDYIYLWLGKVYEGLILFELNDKEKAITSIKKGIEMIEKRGNTKYLAFSYKQLSKIYSKLNNYKMAYQYLNKCDEIIEKINKKV